MRWRRMHSLTGIILSHACCGDTRLPCAHIHNGVLFRCCLRGVSRSHVIHTQAPGTSTGAYLGRREALVLLALQLAGRLNLSDQARRLDCSVPRGLLGRLTGRIRWLRLHSPQRNSKTGLRNVGPSVRQLGSPCLSQVCAAFCCRQPSVAGTCSTYPPLTLLCQKKSTRLRQVAHAAMALCDATMMAGVQLSDKLEALLLAACLRIAAANEGGPAPSPAVVEELIDFPGAFCAKRAHFGP